jgi:hypothetical protein
MAINMRKLKIKYKNPNILNAFVTLSLLKKSFAVIFQIVKQANHNFYSSIQWLLRITFKD